MNTREKQFGFQHKLLVLALLAAFGPAHADGDIDKLIKPDKTVVSVGAATVIGDAKDRSIYGQYNGWSKSDSAVLLDFELIQREDETGTWTTAEGRNLGLDNRELSFSRQKQGDWKVSAAYSEQVRHDPRTLHTGLQGIGNTQLSVNSLAVAGSGASQNLDIKRSSLSVSGEKWISSGVMLEASIKSEDKDGQRLTGVGGYCGPLITGATCPTLSGALLMLAEPISSSTYQMDAKANLIGSKYTLTAGYYGSIYKNDNGSMRVGSINGNLVNSAGAPFGAGSGTNTLGDILMQPIALSPDNQAIQFYLDGTYAIAPTAHATFHYAMTHATQNESFTGMGLKVAAGLPSNLGGVVDSELAQIGFTARPLPKLSLLANVRYEDIRDKTPTALYGGTYSNLNNSSQKFNGKTEATYLFPDSVRATLGVDYAWVQRNVPTVGSSVLYIPTNSLTSIREETTELGYRAEVRKPIFETVNASVAYLQSWRNGSHWINLGSTTATYPNTYQVMRNADVYSVTGIFPTTMMDRVRDKVRVMADWTANDKLSLQFSVEGGQDTYSAPTASGMHSSAMSGASVDGSYAVSDTWKATGYFTYARQALHMDQGSGYVATIDNTSSNYGIGLVGKLSAKWDVGGDFSYLEDRNSYGFGSNTTAPAGALPDVSYRTLALKVFGKYALDTQSDIRVDLVQQTTNFDEWTWASSGVPYAYSDNSTVSMQASQSVTYLGVKYVYRLK